ncbi:FIST signal transduction protein [Nitratiruptor sp. SB155-2]|uniref:FIST signal transduction protein n=1 Tax=Nitratiruptor sp. (strain SB155-2) TaxID=387092 RepID=UPI0002DE5CB1|nr:FIST N-terminal domain-containing protein [Nitratiruptor sp. SB155-2]
MKSFNTVFHSEKQLQTFIKEKGIVNSERLLVQVYSGIVHKTFIEDLLALLASLFPDATIIGSTTAGEIVDSKIYEKNVALSFTNMEHTRIKPDVVTYDQFSSDDPYYDAGVYFKERLVTSDTKFILLLADGMRTNGEELVKGFGKETNIVIGGGLAGDYGQLKNTYVFCKNRVIENGAVAVAFDSKELQVFNYYTTGWKPIGRCFVVTKSTGNIVYELDGEPIYEIYKRYLGKEIAKNLPDSAIEFPLMVEKDGKYIARASIAMNSDGALVFVGNVPESSCVRFGFGNTLLILDTAGKLVKNEMFQKRFESLFIFSCVARKRFLGDLVHEEIRPLKRVSPNIGFFTYGEFVTMNDGHELLNESMTLIAASESEESIKEIDLYNKEFVDDNSTIRAINALINLVEKTTQELEREKSELQSEVQKDGLTGLLNKKSLLRLLKAKLTKRELSFDARYR